MFHETISKCYLLILSIIFVIIVLFTVKFGISDNNISIVITILGGTFSFFYVVQKHVLEYFDNFLRIFEKFNARYNELNEHLNKMRGKIQLDSTDFERLNDYFNLCAEEYLCFKKGLIYEDVWCAWCSGMSTYLEDPNINEYWKKEESSRSYYSLNTKVIEKYSKK